MGMRLAEGAGTGQKYYVPGTPDPDPLTPDPRTYYAQN